jgi:hypothetical protein
MRDLLQIFIVTISIGIAAFTSGCASIGASIGVEASYNAAFRAKLEDISKKPIEDQIKTQQVRFLDESPNLAVQQKGQVVGLSCKLTPAVFVFSWVWHPELNEINGMNPEDAARRQLSFKAMQLGANAVVKASCTHRDGIDWGNNCFESWICTGQAILVP